VRGVLRAKNGQIKYCYEKLSRANPRLSGRVVAAVFISGGKVTSVEIDQNSTGDSELGRCVVGKIRRWRFPPEVSDVVALEWLMKPHDSSRSGAGDPSWEITVDRLVLQIPSQGTGGFFRLPIEVIPTLSGDLRWGGATLEIEDAAPIHAAIGSWRVDP